MYACIAGVGRDAKRHEAGADSVRLYTTLEFADMPPAFADLTCQTLPAAADLSFLSLSFFLPIGTLLIRFLSLLISRAKADETTV